MKGIEGRQHQHQASGLPTANVSLSPATRLEMYNSNWNEHVCMEYVIVQVGHCFSYHSRRASAIGMQCMQSTTRSCAMCVENALTQMHNRFAYTVKMRHVNDVCVCAIERGYGDRRCEKKESQAASILWQRRRCSFCTLSLRSHFEGKIKLKCNVHWAFASLYLWFPT